VSQVREAAKRQYVSSLNELRISFIEAAQNLDTSDNAPPYYFARSFDDFVKMARRVYKKDLSFDEFCKRVRADIRVIIKDHPQFSVDEFINDTINGVFSAVLMGFIVRATTEDECYAYVEVYSTAFPNEISALDHFIMTIEKLAAQGLYDNTGDDTMNDDTNNTGTNDTGTNDTKGTTSMNAAPKTEKKNVFSQIFDFVRGVFSFIKRQAVKAWNFVSKISMDTWSFVSGLFTGIWNSVFGADDGIINAEFWEEVV
jgi:hypothetical protein